MRVSITPDRVSEGRISPCILWVFTNALSAFIRSEFIVEFVIIYDWAEMKIV